MGVFKSSSAHMAQMMETKKKNNNKKLILVLQLRISL